MITDKDKFFAKLEAIGEQTVREKLAQGVYGQGKIPLIEEWLRQLDASRSEGTLSRQEERDLEGNELAREANAVAREANVVARSARDEARLSNRMARWAVIIAIIAAVPIAKDIIIAIFKSS